MAPGAEPALRWDRAQRHTASFAVVFEATGRPGESGVTDVSGVARRTGRLITIEDHALAGGFGAAVLECLSDRGCAARIERLGLPDRFIDHGTQEEQWAEAAIDVDAIVARARAGAER